LDTPIETFQNLVKHKQGGQFSHFYRNFTEKFFSNLTLTTANSLQNSDLKPVKNLPRWARTLLTGLAISLLALALAQQIAFLEAELAKQLLPALAELGGKASNQADWTKYLQFLLLFLVSSLAVETGQRLKQTAGLVVVTIQWNLLAFLVQAFLLQVTPIVISTLIATALATLSGVHFRQTAQRNKLLESQYYEIFIRNRELGQARLDLVEQEEIGRRLLAADLHDQVLNDLKKIVETFSQFEKEPENKEASSAIRAGFNKTMNDIREIMDDLCPIMLQNFGMRAAIEDCLEKGKERSGYKIKFDSDIDDDVLDKLSLVQQSLLFRLVQESLTNISKHAQAKNVSILIGGTKTKLEISIEDDGKGIDYKNISHQSRGLRYMKLRADLINANVDWKPGRNDKGTKVVITFPL